MRIGHLVVENCATAILSDGGTIQVGSLETKNCMFGVRAINNGQVSVENYDFVDTAKAVSVTGGANVALGGQRTAEPSSSFASRQTRRKGVRRYVLGWIPPV